MGKGREGPIGKQYIGMQAFKDVPILVELRVHVCEFFKCINEVFMDFGFMRTYPNEFLCNPQSMVIALGGCWGKKNRLS